MKRGYTLYLDDEIMEKLEKLGKDQKRSSSWLANEFLKEKLKEVEKKK